MSNMGHHIWCNRDPRTDPAKCDMCKEFNKKYPEGGSSPDELVRKHFPGATSRVAVAETTAVVDDPNSQQSVVVRPKMTLEEAIGTLERCVARDGLESCAIALSVIKDRMAEQEEMVRVASERADRLQGHLDLMDDGEECG